MAGAAAHEPPVCPPAPTAGTAPVDRGEAQAKAGEYKDKIGQAKADAQKETPPKPTPGAEVHGPAAPPQPHAKQPTPINKPAGVPAPKPAPAPKAATGAKTGDKAGLPHATGGGGGPAATSAQAACEGDVADFFKKTPHDKKGDQVHGAVKELVTAAGTLKTDAPPKESSAMSVAKMIVPGLDSVGAKPGESDLGKIANITSIGGGANNPYKDLTGKHAKWIQTLAPIRDLLSGVSSILGKVGICLTILGLLISITGIGAPLGGPLTTIGNVITVTCLIMDAICVILSSILTGLLMATLKEETDPIKRKALAQKVKQESANTATALVSVVMAIPGVGKAASMGVGKVMAVVQKIASALKVNVVLKAVLPLAKKIWGGIKKVIGVADKEKGFLGGMAKKGADVMEKFRTWRTGLNESLEKGAVKKFEQSAVGKFGDKFGNKTMAALEKYSGANALKKVDSAIDYYTSKGIAKGDAAATKASEKVFGAEQKVPPIDTQALKDAEAEAAKKTAAAESAMAKAKAEQAAFEKKTNFQGNWDSAEGKAVTKESGAVAKEVDEAEKGLKSAQGEQALAGRGTDAQEIGRAKTHGKEIYGNKDAIVAKEEKEAAKLKGEIQSNNNEVTKATKEQKEAAEKLAEAKQKADEFNKKHGYVKDWESAEGKQVTKESTALAKEMDAAEAASKKAENELKAATSEAKNLESQMHSVEANERAQHRLNEARGNKDSWGGETKVDPEVQKGAKHGGPWEEFKDSFHFKDNAKETMGGQFLEWKEKIEGQQIQKEIQDKRKEQILGEDKRAEKAREKAKEAQEHSEEAMEHGGKHEVTGGAAPKLPGVEDTGGTKGRVTNLLQDLTPRSKLEADGEHGKAGAPAGNGGPQQGDKPPGQQQPAADQEQPPKAPEAAKPDDKGGEKDDGQAGTIPYWPELLTQYSTDLGDLDKAETELKKYKSDQIASYNAAVGIETAAQREKEAASGRKQQQQDNIQQANKDASALTKNAGDNKVVSAKGDESKGKKNEAKTEGDKGAAAASAQPEEPQKDTSWWGKFKAAINVVKNWILGKLAAGMKWIQDQITKVVMRVMGIKPEDVKELTDDTAEKGKQGAGEAKEAAGQTQEAEAQDDGSVTKSGMAMSEAKKLQAETKANCASADGLLQTIASLKGDINKEIEQGKKYIADVNAAYAQEKQKGQKEQKEQEAAAKGGGANKGGEPSHAPGEKPGDKEPGKKDDPKKDEADPGQVARIKQAARIVVESDSSNAQKLQGAFNAGKGMLANGKNPEAVQQATTVFEGSHEIVDKFSEGAKKRVSDMQAVIGKDHLTVGDVSEQVGKVEDAAAHSDEEFHGALEALQKDFSACYDHAHKTAPAPKKKPTAPAQADPGPGLPPGQAYA